MYYDQNRKTTNNFEGSVFPFLWVWKKFALRYSQIFCILYHKSFRVVLFCKIIILRLNWVRSSVSDNIFLTSSAWGFEISLSILYNVSFAPDRNVDQAVSGSLTTIVALIEIPNAWRWFFLENSFWSSLRENSSRECKV